MAAETMDRQQIILAFTREIEAARRSVEANATPAARDRLCEAQAVYKAYLSSLNGLSVDP